MLAKGQKHGAWWWGTYKYEEKEKKNGRCERGIYRQRVAKHFASRDDEFAVAGVALGTRAKEALWDNVDPA